MREAITELDRLSAALEEALRIMKPFADFIEQYEHNGGSVRKPSVAEYRAALTFQIGRAHV